MAFLEQFSSAEQALLVILPYRAGLWISVSDTAGGTVADAQERAMLARIIAASARSNFSSPFVREVVRECYGRRAEWSQWRENIDSVPQECRQAVAILEGRLNARDIQAYREQIMSISNSVAKAFREKPEKGAVSFYVRLMLNGLISLINHEKYDSVDLLNISVKEDMALGTLAEALRMPAG